MPTKRWVPGEKDGGLYWHEVDEAGPDHHDFLGELPNLLSFHKTICGMHYGADPVVSDEPPTSMSFTPCPDCT